jgi:phosphohistidine phosphatase SixA
MRTLLLLLAQILLAAPAPADEAAVWAALREGGNVALMRHTEAPGPGGDPPGFRLDDCKTQRNLSAQGRADARAAGARLKARGVTFAKVLSSPWCRCVDTATLMSVGAVQIEPAFSNIVVLNDRVGELTAAGRAVINAWKGPGTLLVVTHGANISALTGGPGPASGEMVVVSAQSGGPPRELGRLPIARQ